MKALQSIAGGLFLTVVLCLMSCKQEIKWPALPVEEATPYFADAAKTRTLDTAFYEIQDAQGTKLGTILFSSPYSDDIKGFNGPTPLLIAMDADGRIKDVVLLENQETTWYAQHVKEGGLYQQWNGLTPAEALEKDVDAISGATYTSNGVKKSLIARLKAYERQVK